MQCPRCGRPRSECSDPEKAWYPQREVCYATREREAASAAYADLHKDRPWTDGTYEHWSKDRSASHPYKAEMGMTIGVADTDIRPDDLFTTRERAPLVKTAPEVESEQATPE